MRKAFYAQLVFLGEVVDFLDGRADLHNAVGHFVHAVFQAERQVVELVHLFKDAAPAGQHLFRAGFDIGGYRADALDGLKHFLTAVFLFVHGSRQFGAHAADAFGQIKNGVELFFDNFRRRRQNLNLVAQMAERFRNRLAL